MKTQNWHSKLSSNKRTQILKHGKKSETKKSYGTWIIGTTLTAISLIIGIIKFTTPLIEFWNAITDSATKIEIKAETIKDSFNPTFNIIPKEPQVPDEENFYHKIYPNYKNQGNDIIEVRPQQGRWFPFFIAIPSEEIDTVGIKEELLGDNPTIIICNSPSGQPPFLGIKCSTPQPFLSEDKKWWILKNDCQATQEESFYIRYKSQPTILYYGQENGTIYSITK